MSLYLGIDTSNYTTSAACADNNEIVRNEKQMLAVKAGERGLRQSDAVFLHTVNLPVVIERMGKIEPCAIGYSAYPRDSAGSYMPCFLAGENSARCISSVLGIPVYKFSHQAGHIAAAVYSSGNISLRHREFLAFHVSGGTTELLYVTPDDGICGYNIKKLGGTLDISAGQAIDRIGVKLGLQFPCGSYLEKLAGCAVEMGIDIPQARICVKDLNCNLSGLENKVDDMLKDGMPNEVIAMYTLNFIKNTLAAMTINAAAVYGNIPVLYAGGVMCNSYIKQYLADKSDAYFAKPEYSSDNAAGIALLCGYRHEKT